MRLHPRAPDCFACSYGNKLGKNKKEYWKHEKEVFQSLKQHFYLLFYCFSNLSLLSML